jgi:tripartite-type tricarboxylate transporter receptor subunit TctC
MLDSTAVLKPAQKLLRLTAGFAAGLLLAVASPANAEWKPDRPVRILVPFAPGGASDTMVRLVAAEASKTVGQQIVIENKPGASGKILYEYLKVQPADGYTLGYVSTTGAVLSAVSSKLDFDIQKDFVPITVLAEFTSVLAASAAVPAKDFREFVAYAKANPGKLSYGSYGVKGQGHLNMEQIKLAADINLVHVPFRGEAPTLQALLRNDVQIGPLILSSKQYVDAGQIKILAALGTMRSPEYPDIPTLIEQGFPVSSKTWMGMSGPPGMSQEIAAFWNRTLVAAVQQPLVVQRLKDLGLRARGTPPEDVTKELQGDIDLYGRVVVSAQIELD